MVSSAVQCVHCTKVASNVLYQEMALVCGTPVVSSVVKRTENRLSRHLGLNFSLLRKICETTKCLDAWILSNICNIVELRKLTYSNGFTSATPN